MIRLDSPLIPSRFVVGNGGLGVKVKDIPTDGFMYGRFTQQIDGEKRARALILQRPAEGVLSVKEDSEFAYAGPDGLHSFVYQLFVDGVAVGTPEMVTISVGESNTGSEVSVVRSALWTIQKAAEATYEARWSIRSEIAQAVTANWSIISAVAKEIQTSWDMGSLVEIEQGLAWTLANTVEKQITLDWKSAELVEKEVDLEWSASKTVDQNVELIWSSSVASEHRLELRWTLEHNDFVNPINIILVKDENRIIIVN